MEELEDQHKVEISSWARIVHTPTEKPPGGTYTAYDRETKEFAGAMGYFFMGPDTIMFREVHVTPKYQRRKVATALLRYMNLDYPNARINPGTRKPAGQAFMDHILKSEPEKVATNGILEIPLQNIEMIPPGERPGANVTGDETVRTWG